MPKKRRLSESSTKEKDLLKPETSVKLSRIESESESKNRRKKSRHKDDIKSGRERQKREVSQKRDAEKDKLTSCKTSDKRDGDRLETNRCKIQDSKSEITQLITAGKFSKEDEMSPIRTDKPQ